jgi:hypothetical protein
MSYDKPYSDKHEEKIYNMTRFFIVYTLPNVNCNNFGGVRNVKTCKKS